MSDNYWTRIGSHRLGRRGFLAGGATLAVGAAAIAIGCGDDDDDDAPDDTPTQSTEQPQAGGTLKRYKSAPSLGPDPQVQVVSNDEIMGGCYSAMNTYTLSTNEVVVDLATGYEQPDNQTIIWTMRDGVKFHSEAPMNGRLMTSEDPKFSWERLPNAFENLGSSVTKSTWGWSDLGGGGIDTPDERTVVQKQLHPFASNFAAMASFGWNVVAREAVESTQYSPEGRLTIIAGSGPYKMTREDSTGTTLERNPDYYQRTDAVRPFRNGGPLIDKIEHRIITDTAARKSAFLSGEVDIWGTSDIIEFAEMEKDDDFVTVRLPQPVGIGLFFDLNPGDTDWFDARAREALDLAIDREELIATIYAGDALYGSPVSNVFAGAGFVFSQEELKELQPFDPERAKQLWEAAGEPFDKITFIAISGSALNMDMTTFVADQLTKNLGVETVIDALDQNSYVAAAVAPGRKSWDVFVAGIPQVPTLPEYNALGMYLPTGFAGQLWGFNEDNPNQEIAALAKEATRLDLLQQSQIDPTARGNGLKDLQRFLV
ncbi:MAG TPA: ABC transporter substrate-binding protein, partial [Dehalococcoidia bacterium]|nr:ABC transporter substrate-binding protein [Dehalococcoidia bacterium]